MPILRYGSTGAYVEWLQSTLKKLGYYNGKVDGIYGQQTLEAVKNFQKAFEISQDGIVGNVTWNTLMPYLNGKLFDIVPTDIIYPYSIMIRNMNALINKYPFLEYSYYGKSVMGKNLPVIRIGKGSREIFYSASIHANEWINTVVFMKYIEDFAKAYENNGKIFGYDAKKIFDETTIYLAPMANPDGVDLVLWQLPTTSKAYINAKNIGGGYPNIPFPNGWKANIVRCRFKFTVPCKMGISKRNKI